MLVALVCNLILYYICMLPCISMVWSRGMSTANMLSKRQRHFKMLYLLHRLWFHLLVTFSSNTFKTLKPHSVVQWCYSMLSTHLYSHWYRHKLISLLLGKKNLFRLLCWASSLFHQSLSQVVCKWILRAKPDKDLPQRLSTYSLATSRILYVSKIQQKM